MCRYKKNIFKILLYSCSIVIFGEVIRDIFREGDFGGYVSAGKLAFNNLTKLVVRKYKQISQD